MTEVDVAELLPGVSAPIRQIRAVITKVAREMLPVLVQGPTGAGKEVVVRALHRAGNRLGRLVAFNVCALPDSMFESSLFGHVRGAFTGADADSPGLLMEAHRGTAFFDEMSGLSLANQLKLLRVIERHEFRPLGSREDRQSEFRVVAASNADLFALAETGRFRPDLVQRLAGIVLMVPALAERPEDIRPLALRFLKETAATSRRSVTFSEEGLRFLEAHSWPGNVRELRLAVERVVLLTEGEIVGRSELARFLRISTAANDTEGRFDPAARQALLSLLETAGWDTALLAQRLGTHRATVYRRMRRLGIERPRLAGIAAARDGAQTM